MTRILLVMLLSSNQCHALLGSAEPPPQNGSAFKGIAGCAIELRTDTERVHFNDYLHHAYFSVKKHWFAEMPGSLAKGQQGINAIEFHTLQDGSVPKDSVKMVTSSGKCDFDAASLQAIQEAPPF